MIVLLLVVLGTACAQDSNDVQESDTEALESQPSESSVDSDEGVVPKKAQASAVVSSAQAPEPITPPGIEQQLNDQINRVDALIQAMNKLADEQTRESE